MSFHKAKTVEEAFGKATGRGKQRTHNPHLIRCEALLRQFQNERRDFEIGVMHFSDLSRDITRLSRQNSDELDSYARNALMSVAGVVGVAWSRIKTAKDSTSIHTDGRKPNVAEWIAIIATLERLSATINNYNQFNQRHDKIMSLVTTVDRLSIRLNEKLRNMVRLIEEMDREGCFGS